MKPVYHLSFLRFLWLLVTVPGALYRYDGSSNYDMLYRAFSWLAFLRRENRLYGRWTMRFPTDQLFPFLIGFVDDRGEFFEVMRMNRGSEPPAIWQDRVTLYAYKYYHQNKTIYRL